MQCNNAVQCNAVPFEMYDKGQAMHVPRPHKQWHFAKSKCRLACCSKAISENEKRLGDQPAMDSNVMSLSEQLCNLLDDGVRCIDADRCGHLNDWKAEQA